MSRATVRYVCPDVEIGLLHENLRSEGDNDLFRGCPCTCGMSMRKTFSHFNTLYR